MRPVTAILILANVIVFGIQRLYGDVVIAHLALWPLGHFSIPEADTAVGFEPWQLVTSAFLHANTLHIALNMFALFMFGRSVEAALGSWRFLALYFMAVLSSGITQLIVTSLGDAVDPVPTLGASGGVFGVLLAF